MNWHSSVRQLVVAIEMTNFQSATPKNLSLVHAYIFLECAEILNGNVLKDEGDLCGK